MTTYILKMGKLVANIMLFIVFQVVYCAALFPEETREMKIGINDDGSLIDASGVPNCGSGRKLHLMSYRYCQIECSFGQCLSTFETTFSSKAELLLHERCSMQRECTYLSFPLRSALQKNQTNAVCLKFQCLGDEDAWVDICTIKDLEVNKPTYLIATNTTRFFKECRCFVNKGHFLLNVTDLRLKSMNSRNCSSAVLKINGNVFSCDIAQDDYGSTFNNKVLESPKKDLFISIRSLSDETLPDMIWLTLIPRESAKITCFAVKRTHQPTPPAIDNIVSTVSYVVNNTTLTGENKDTSVSENKVSSMLISLTTALIVVIVTMLIIFSIVFIFLVRRNRRLKKLNRGPKSPRSSSGIPIPCSDNTLFLDTSPMAHIVMVHSSLDDQISPPIITLPRKSRVSLQSVPTNYEDSGRELMEMTERKTVAASNSDDETIVGLLNQASTSEYQLGMICEQTS